KKIGQTVPRQMTWKTHTPREYQPLRRDTARLRRGLEVTFGVLIIRKQPENASRDPVQQPHPDIENLGHDLVVVVEAAENKALLRQPRLDPYGRGCVNSPLGIVDLIAVRERHDLLAIIGSVRVRDQNAVGEDIVVE